MPIPPELQNVNAKRKVLIVDDNPTDAKLYQQVLNESGFETRIAKDGLVAGALLTTFQPSVMTLDLNMKGLSGLEVIKMVRSMELPHAIKILVVSEMSGKEFDEALAAGADDVLQKPSPYKLLVEKVSHLAGLKKWESL